MSQTQDQISDEERDAGAYVIRHRFGEHNVRNRTIAELWTSEPETVIALSKWRKCRDWFPQTFEALKRWFAIERIGKTAAKIISKSQPAGSMRSSGDQFRQWGL